MTSIPRQSVRGIVGGLLIASTTVSQASQPDIFHAARQVSETPAGVLLGLGVACTFPEVGSPLPLAEAVERSLCNNPQTRQAWVRIKVQAEGVGVRKAAYLPTLTGTVQKARDQSSTSVDGHPELNSDNRSSAVTGSVSLSWVLYDFGGREAALQNAVALLAAAQANHQAVLQAVFTTTSKDYYAAQAAQGVFETSIDIEGSARGSFDAASGRVGKGVAPISDQLQAQTALAQATYNRAKARGDWQTALGVLATDLGLRPDQGLRLPAVEDGVKPDAEFTESTAELMTQAQREHPSVLQAQAELRAAEASVEQTKAQGLPSVSLVARSSRNNQPISPFLGQPLYSASGRDLTLGVEVNIPLFEGFARNYQIREARAQAELQGVAVDQAKSQVALDVWTSYQALQSATQNVGNSAQLLDIAEASEAASRDRYVAGVGSILEFLNAQSAFATARRQRLQALTDWRAARLQLAGRLGRLGMWNLSP